jgi:hypothetical protein
MTNTFKPRKWDLDTQSIQDSIDKAFAIFRACNTDRYKGDRIEIQGETGLSIYFDNRENTGEEFLSTVLSITSEGFIERYQEVHLYRNDEAYPWQNWLNAAYQKEVKKEGGIEPQDPDFSSSPWILIRADMLRPETKASLPFLPVYGGFGVAPIALGSEADLDNWKITHVGGRNMGPSFRNYQQCFRALKLLQQLPEFHVLVKRAKTHPGLVGTPALFADIDKPIMAGLNQVKNIVEEANCV